MIRYPLVFEARSESKAGIQATWRSTSGDFSNLLAVPPEFEGPGGGLSPEDLYNQALTNCFVATFKVYAEKSKLEFEGLETYSQLTVDLDEQKRPVMKEFHLKVKIFRPSNEERVLLLAKKASQSGFILNSVKTQCHFDFEVVRE
jgi:organic hydroperoxide reductase OsmC/OhrA